MNRLPLPLFVLLAAGVFWTYRVLALDYDYGKAQEFQVPERRVSIIATDTGYYPRELSVFEGEKVQFFVTSTTKAPSCLMIPGLELFMAAEKGQVSEGQAYFKRPGVYDFECPAGKIKGRITVLERPEKTRERQMKREIASDKLRVWIPRDK